MKDPTTGNAFFKHDHADIFENEMRYVRAGMLSDPPDTIM
jgi:hypothetical protein